MGLTSSPLRSSAKADRDTSVSLELVVGPTTSTLAKFLNTLHHLFYKDFCYTDRINHTR